MLAFIDSIINNHDLKIAVLIVLMLVCMYWIGYEDGYLYGENDRSLLKKIVLVSVEALVAVVLLVSSM